MIEPNVAELVITDLRQRLATLEQVNDALRQQLAIQKDYATLATDSVLELDRVRDVVRRARDYTTDPMACAILSEALPKEGE